jgi:hypothetical protein
VSFQCFGDRPDGGQTDDVTYGHAPAGRPEEEGRLVVLLELRGVRAFLQYTKSK